MKPQDILVLLKLIARGSARQTQGQLSVELGMSVSEVNAGLKRLVDSGLCVCEEKTYIPIVSAVEEFCFHALKFVFPASIGAPARGMLTGVSADVFADEFSDPGELPVVWSWAEGEARGVALDPLYRSVPYASSRDVELYELLCIVDVLRGRSARASKVAQRLFKEKLRRYEKY